jgi:hypothetical protein
MKPRDCPCPAAIQESEWNGAAGKFSSVWNVETEKRSRKEQDISGSSAPRTSLRREGHRQGYSFGAAVGQ